MARTLNPALAVLDSSVPGQAASRADRELASPALSPLREELALRPGPTLRSGAPTWTLYDPATNRFYRIGWLEFEILCRWHLGRPEEIAKRIARETTLRPTAEEVNAFVAFLATAELLRRSDAQGTSRLCDRKATARTNWLTWLVHHYLFVRIPLVRPDRLLEALLPWLSWVYSRAFLCITIMAGLFGLYLALRQWDTFTTSILWFFSLEGMALAAAALLASKVLHELGHGLTAKYFGCHIPTMGVALLVMMPVLYTDTSAAWHLRERSKRLAIGAAGVGAECCLAAYAILLWSFLPDGIFRSIVFMWATTTWVLTVAINMSPFMRFDGYYLLSDLLDVPNLQDRSFALARHRLREALFGFGDAPPEVWPRPMRRLLLFYAFATWVYRFVLFLGIAVLVYYMFFKALGIILFAVEIWWFIVRPIAREIEEWAKRARTTRLNRRTVMTLTALGVAAVLLLVPWHTSVHAPALMAADTRVRLFSQLPGSVVAVLVKPGDYVKEGAPLIEFSSPDIAFKVAQAERRVASLRAEIQAASQEPEHQSRAQVLARSLDGAQAEVAAAAAERSRLVVRAPISGMMVEVAEPLGVGEWVKSGELLGIVADISNSRIDAYVEEADLQRLTLGGTAVFVPSDLTFSRTQITVTEVDRTAVRTLADQELASVHGGGIATRAGPNDTLVPDVPVYRVTLKPLEPVVLRHAIVGHVILEGRPASLAGRAWRKVVSVLIRESGF